MVDGSRRKSRQKARNAFRAFLARLPSDDEFYGALFTELDLPDPGAASDRSVVIVGTAYIDYILEQAVRRHFSPSAPIAQVAALFLASQNGALVSLNAKAKLACALGILREEGLEDLDTIALIRNGFAHHPVTFSFNNPEVSELCSHFNVLDEPDLRHIQESGVAKRKFVSAIAIYYDLLNEHRPTRERPEPSP